MDLKTTKRTINWIELKTLMRIRSLELRAKVVVEGFWKGIHASPFHGFSVEFSEYRPYSPGDDPRYVDWRLYARSDRFYVKRYADETNLRCLLVLDSSRSMSYGSLGHTKWQYAGTLAATLAYLLFIQGDAVGLATFDGQINRYIPPRNRPGYIKRLLIALEDRPSGRQTDLRTTLQAMWQVCTRRQMVILISDMMTTIDHLDSDLGYLRAAGHDVILFQTLDPMEMSLAIDRPSILQDMESQQRILIDPSIARQEYRQRLQAHLSALSSMCQGLGIDYHLCSTDRPLELALIELLQHRQFVRRLYRLRSQARRSR